MFKKLDIGEELFDAYNELHCNMVKKYTYTVKATDFMSPENGVTSFGMELDSEIVEEWVLPYNNESLNVENMDDLHSLMQEIEDKMLEDWTQKAA